MNSIKNIILFYLILLATNVSAQTNDFGFLTVDVNPTTYRIENSLPLNTEFFIKLPIEDFKGIKKAYLLEEMGSLYGDPMPLSIGDVRGKNIFLKTPALFRQSNYKLVIISGPSKKQMEVVLRTAIILTEMNKDCNSAVDTQLSSSFAGVFQKEMQLLSKYKISQTLLPITDMCSLAKESFNILDI